MLPVYVFGNFTSYYPYDIISTYSRSHINLLTMATNPPPSQKSPRAYPFPISLIIDPLFALFHGKAVIYTKEHFADHSANSSYFVEYTIRILFLFAAVKISDRFSSRAIVTARPMDRKYIELSDVGGSVSRRTFR
jgi:hypothetical protein